MAEALNEERSRSVEGQYGEQYPRSSSSGDFGGQGLGCPPRCGSGLLQGLRDASESTYRWSIPLQRAGLTQERHGNRVRLAPTQTSRIAPQRRARRKPWTKLASVTF